MDKVGVVAATFVLVLSCFSACGPPRHMKLIPLDQSFQPADAETAREIIVSAVSKKVRNKKLTFQGIKEYPAGKQVAFIFFDPENTYAGKWLTVMQFPGRSKHIRVSQRGSRVDVSIPITNCNEGLFDQSLFSSLDLNQAKLPTGKYLGFGRSFSGSGPAFRFIAAFCEVFGERMQGACERPIAYTR